MFSTVWKISMEAKPTQIRLPMVVLAIRAVWIHRQTTRNSIRIMIRHPTSPSSSPHTAKIRSVCRSGRFSDRADWVWMPWKSPWPKTPPLPMAMRLRVCCQPTPCGSKLWSKITRKRLAM